MKISIEPQRKVKGAGWVGCEPHLAGRWAVTVQGRVSISYKQKHLAVQHMMMLERRAQGPVGHGYKLGRRMQERSQ